MLIIKDFSELNNPGISVISVLSKSISTHFNNTFDKLEL